MKNEIYKTNDHAKNAALPKKTFAFFTKANSAKEAYPSGGIKNIKPF
jgi:hypothetical protein